MERPAGRIQQRVHVVAEPLTDYMRFELTVALEERLMRSLAVFLIVGDGGVRGW